MVDNMPTQKNGKHTMNNLRALNLLGWLIRCLLKWASCKFHKCKLTRTHTHTCYYWEVPHAVWSWLGARVMTAWKVSQVSLPKAYPVWWWCSELY